MGDLTNLTLAEIRERAYSDSSPGNFKLLAQKLLNEQHLVESAGDRDKASQLSEELRQLADARQEQLEIVELYAGCLYNSFCKVIEAADKERGISLLAQLRDLQTGDPSSQAITEHYAISLNNAHVRAGKWEDFELGQYARDELARLSELPEASSRVIEFYATSLSDGNFRLQKSNDGVGARALLESLEELAECYPNNRLIANRLARASSRTATFASRGNAVEEADRELDRLREICADPDKAAFAREQLGFAIHNIYIGLGEDVIGSDRAEALLSEAQVLAEQTDEIVFQEYLARLLRTKHYYLVVAGEFEPAADLTQELLSLERRSLGEIAVVEQLAALLQNGHSLSRQQGRPDLTVGYLTTFRGLYSRNTGRKKVIEYFAQCVINSHFEAGRDPAHGSREGLLAEIEALYRAHRSENRVLELYVKALNNSLNDLPESSVQKLRSLHEAHAESEVVASTLSVGLRVLCFSAIKESGDVSCNKWLQELRDLANRHRELVEVTHSFMASLMVWYVWGSYKHIGVFTDKALDEARSIYHGRLSARRMTELMARMLFTAKGVAWRRLKISSIRELGRELDALEANAASDPALREELTGMRREDRKHSMIMLGAGIFVDNRSKLLLGWLTGFLIWYFFFAKS